MAAVGDLLGRGHALRLATVLFFVVAAFRRGERGALGPGGRRLRAPPALRRRWPCAGRRWATGRSARRYEVLSANAFVLVVLFLLAQLWAPPLRALGAFVLPAVFLMMGWAVDTFGVRNEVPIIFKSFWL